MYISFQHGCWGAVLYKVKLDNPFMGSRTCHCERRASIKKRPEWHAMHRSVNEGPWRHRRHYHKDIVDSRKIQISRAITNKTRKAHSTSKCIKCPVSGVYKKWPDVKETWMKKEKNRKNLFSSLHNRIVVVETNKTKGEIYDGPLLLMGGAPHLITSPP